MITVSPSVYTLLPFADVFNPDKKIGNKEEIFVVQFGLAPSTGTITPRMQLPKSVFPKGGNEAFYVENAFALSYSNTDLRKAATIGAFQVLLNLEMKNPAASKRSAGFFQ